MPKKKKKQELKLNWKTAYELWQERQNIKRISTGTPIDELIGGGIEEGSVTEFYGEFGSGKSQILFTLSAYVAGELKEDVVFVDCEDTFKPERIREILEWRGYPAEESMKRIHLLQPITVEELTAIFNQIPENIKPKLLCIDGVTTLFRAEFIGRETLTERQGILRKFLHDLKQWARQNKVAVAITNQVYGSPDATPFTPLEYKELAVGGHSLYHTVGDRIFLRKGKGGTRIAKLVDSSSHPPAERPFKITEKGIEPVTSETTQEGE